MDKLNQWLALVANVGVVLGLFFVGFEVRQNAEFLQFSAALENRRQVVEQLRSVRDSPDLAEILAKLEAEDELTRAESIRYSNHLSSTWAWVYSDWIQREMGLAGPYVQSRGGPIGIAMSLPDSGAWWKRAKETGLYPDQFVSYVEKIYASSHGQ